MMVKKIIVVTGNKGSGKTTAIHEAATLLGCGLTANSPRDLFMITDLKIKGRIVRVGIASSGDSADIIKENIDRLYGCDLDYMILACSSPQTGMAVINGLVALERCALAPIPSPWLANPTPQQISAKVASVAQQIRSELP